MAKLKARTADAGQALADLVREGQRFDLVVLDPPREGAPDVVAGIPSLAPRAVAYVACDPVTLVARPEAAAGGRPARSRSVQAFDMFPRTHHFETLVWLEAAAEYRRIRGRGALCQKVGPRRARLPKIRIRSGSHRCLPRKDLRQCSFPPPASASLTDTLQSPRWLVTNGDTDGRARAHRAAAARLHGRPHSRCIARCAR